MKRNFYNLPMRADPAPSRVAYLFRRFWLRKSFRLLFISFVPVSVILLFLFSIGKKHDLHDFIGEKVQGFSKFVALNPAFKVVNLSVISENHNVVEKIKSTLDLKFPISSLDINVGNLKKRVEEINLVRSASVRLTSNGLIEVLVEVREPIAVQRIGKKFLLLDATGVEVDEVFSRSQRLDLPLLVGEGADRKVQEALTLLLETKNLLVRVRGLVRIGQRRWDVILDRNQVIKLPEKNPIKAMKKVISLQEGRQLLDRDILYLDFRNINRPVLGLTDEMSNELRGIRNFVRGENV